MLYISHLLKGYSLVFLAGIALSACTTTTTLVEPEAAEHVALEQDVVVPPEPDSVLQPSVSGKPVTHRPGRALSSPTLTSPERTRPREMNQKRERMGDNPPRVLVETAPAATPEAETSKATAAVAEKVTEETAKEDAAKKATEIDPLTEQYRIDSPKFDPALGEESSESSASSEDVETSENSESSERIESTDSSANSDSSQSSDNTQSSASQSELAPVPESATDKPETTAPQGASATNTQIEKSASSPAATASSSQALSDEELAREQIAGGGPMTPEQQASAEKAEENKPEPSASAVETASAKSEPAAPPGAEETKAAGSPGGLNVPPEQPSAPSDKTDHSEHDHRYIADKHVEGAEEPPLKKTKPLHWNMQRQVRKTEVE